MLHRQLLLSGRRLEPGTSWKPIRYLPGKINCSLELHAKMINFNVDIWCQMQHMGNSGNRIALLHKSWIQAKLNEMYWSDIGDALQIHVSHSFLKQVRAKAWQAALICVCFASARGSLKAWKLVWLNRTVENYWNFFRKGLTPFIKFNQPRCS
jgi:hypothetical protein